MIHINCNNFLMSPKKKGVHALLLGEVVVEMILDNVVAKHGRDWIDGA